MNSNRIETYTMDNFSVDYMSTVTAFSNSEKKELLGTKNTRSCVTKVNRVLKAINDLVLDEIMLNNYEYVLGNNFVVRMERHPRNFDKLAVNWGASNKLKNEILARGGKPAKKIGVSAKGNPIFDDGEQWMVFYTDDFYCALMYKDILKRIDGKQYHSSFGSIFIDVIPNVKMYARFSNYEKEGKITKEKIRLTDGTKNYFV